MEIIDYYRVFIDGKGYYENLLDSFGYEHALLCTSLAEIRYKKLKAADFINQPLL